MEGVRYRQVDVRWECLSFRRDLVILSVKRSVRSVGFHCIIIYNTIRLFLVIFFFRLFTIFHFSSRSAHFRYWPSGRIKIIKSNGSSETMRFPVEFRHVQPRPVRSVGERFPNNNDASIDGTKRNDRQYNIYFF